MMIRKQSLRYHTMIRCPENAQQTDKEHLTQKRDFNKVTAKHFYSNYPSAWVPPPSVGSPYMPQKTS